MATIKRFNEIVAWQKEGSVGELASQLYHARDCGYIDDVEFDSLQERLKLISAMLYNLIKSMKESGVKGERYK